MTTYGTGSLIGKVMPSGFVPLNITDPYISRVYCHPTLGNYGTALVSGTTANAFGGWVQMIDPLWTSKNFTLLGYAVYSADEFEGSDFTGASVQFGVGSSGSESVFASSNIPRLIMGTNGLRVLHTMPLSFAGIIPVGSRVSMRIADGDASAITYYFKLMFTTNIRQGGIYLNNYTTHPSNFNTVAVTTSATAWTYGSYVQLVGENTIRTDYYIRGIHLLHPDDTTYQSQIALAIGPSGWESYAIMAELAFHYNYHSQFGAQPHYFPLSTAIKIPANARLSVAAAKSGSGADTLVAGVDIAQGTFYG